VGGVAVVLVVHGDSGVEPTVLHPEPPVLIEQVRAGSGETRRGVAGADEVGGVAEGLAGIGRDGGNLGPATADEFADRATAEVLPGGVTARRGADVAGDPLEACEARVGIARVGGVARVGLGVADVIPVDAINRVVGDEFADDADKVLLHVGRSGIEDVLTVEGHRSLSDVGRGDHDPLRVSGEQGVVGRWPRGAHAEGDEPGVHFKALGVGLLTKVCERIDPAADVGGFGEDGGVPVGPVGTGTAVLVGEDLGDDGVVVALSGPGDHRVDFGGAFESGVEGVSPEGAERGLRVNRAGAYSGKQRSDKQDSVRPPVRMLLHGLTTSECNRRADIGPAIPFYAGHRTIINHISAGGWGR